MRPGGPPGGPPLPLPPGGPGGAAAARVGGGANRGSMGNLAPLWAGMGFLGFRGSYKYRSLEGAAVEGTVRGWRYPGVCSDIPRQAGLIWGSL